MPNITDLHIHTNYSDGKLTIDDVFALAKKNKVKSISITDHDNILNDNELNELSFKYNIEYIQGSEISCFYNDIEIHILAYGFDCSNKALNKFVKAISDSRKIRAKKILNNLNKKYKFNLHFDDLNSINGYYGRPQIADLLIKKKICKSIKQAFIEYLGNTNEVVEKKLKINVIEIIKAISEAGGKSVIAHFSKYKNWNMLDELRIAGLDGIEIYHPSHSNTLIKDLLIYTKKHNLLNTGGSDFHGNNLKKSTVGSLRVDYDYFKKLKDSLY